jgi:1,4-alpha-glucan branching enzyme
MKKVLVFVLASFALGPWLHAQPISWEPGLPSRQQTITITSSAFQPGDVLHWAVTVDDIAWQRPIPAFRPTGSTLYGNAIRTPFTADPERAGYGHVEIGPFDQPQQTVKEIVFAISRADGSWDNNQGDDYSIPLTSGRVTIEPAAPTANDPVVVTIRNSAPGTLLRWGVNAERGGWEAVDLAYCPPGSERADDEVGTDTPLPPPDEDGHARITLGPFNRGEQVIDSLHMAVHWKGVWDTDSGRNYNFELDWQADADALRLVHPNADAAAHSVLTATVERVEAVPVELWLDGEQLITLPADQNEHVFSLTNLPYGAHRLTARAVTSSGTLLDSTEFWRVPAMENQPRPRGLSYGATDHGDGTVSFALYAPGKQFVELVGDWSDEPEAMHRAPDGSWWLTLDLAPGTYRYQYLIEAGLSIADPYAVEVDWTTPDGRKGWEPQHAQTVIHVGADPFAWTANDYQRPGLDELVIYELYIEDFAPGEGFAGIIDRLDYIADLGVNAIEPMPWHPWPGDESWGYNPAFHLAVEQLYGTPEELKALIDAAHNHGMAVIIDMVLNHAAWSSPIYQLYGNDYDASPYFRAHTGHNWGFPKIDQRSPAVKRYAADIIRHWITDFRIDGFRYDATRWTGWSGYNDWGASWFAYVAKSIDRRNIQIAEHLPIEPPLITGTEMDTGWHAEYRWRIREMLNSATLNPDALAEALDATRVGFTAQRQRIPYTESHDEERVVRDLRLAGFDEPEVFRRAGLAMAITLTTPGIPMIYAGQEFGEATDKRVGWNPLNWSLLNQAPNRQLHDLTRRLIRLRVAHPALRGDRCEILVNDGNTGLAVYQRGTGAEQVIVALNFGRGEVSTTINLDEAASWQDAITGSDVEAGALSVSLQPGEARVWATRLETAMP